MRTIIKAIPLFLACAGTAASQEPAEALEAAAAPALTEVKSAPTSRAEFTFKRIKAPKPGEVRRINIQIDPEEQARLLALPFLPPKKGPRPKVSLDDLPEEKGSEAPVYMDPAVTAFWDELGTGFTSGGPARMMKATDYVSRTGGIGMPSLTNVQKVAARHGQAILSSTIGTRVSPALALAVIMTESSGRPDAVSGAGAEGLMQLIPATAERFGVKDSMDPKSNIRGGVAYLDWLLDEFDGDVLLALAGYNAGEGAVRKNGGIPPYAETRAYVPKVIAAWSIARSLCLTMPELASDGCVFGTMASN